MHSTPDLKTGIRKIKGGIAILNVTSHCNAKCKFCSEGGHEHPVHVPLSIIKRTVSSLKSRGVREISFMGGETTLRHDLEEILKFSKEQGMAIYMVTNGLRFSDASFAKRTLRFLDGIEISAHTAEKEMYKDIMGTDGFEQLLEGIGNIKKYNRCVAVFFNFVPNSINAEKITDVFRLLKKIFKNNRFLIHVKTLNVEGKVAEAPYLLPDYGHFRPFLRRALLYAEKRGIGAVISRFPMCIYTGFEHLCLELPLEIRENPSFFHNDRLLSETTDFSRASMRPSSAKGHFFEPCRACSLRRICPGIDPGYFKARKTVDFLSPQKKGIAIVMRKMLEESRFFKLDYSYHNYPDIKYGKIY
ncbi:MAG TPA: hypothetical protein DCL35_02580 [Candidatus Omnitrophica bacterium]|nr:hypothetical protein [Candidatus Omnitrophota bacterium]